MTKKEAAKILLDSDRIWEYGNPPRKERQAITMAIVALEDSAEPKKGQWIKTGNKREKEPRKIWWFECSECEFRLTYPTDRTVYNYCPSCGLKMEVSE